MLNGIKNKKFSGWNYRNHFRRSWRASQEQAWYSYCACWEQWFDEKKKVLNNVKKNIKSVKRSTPPPPPPPKKKKTKKTSVFRSDCLKRKKKNIDKEVLDTNTRLRNFLNQRNIDYIDNTNIKEDHLGNKKFHLNKRGNSVFPQNVLRYLPSKYWEMLTLTVSREVMMNVNLKP